MIIMTYGCFNNISADLFHNLYIYIAFIHSWIRNTCTYILLENWPTVCEPEFSPYSYRLHLSLIIPIHFSFFKHVSDNVYWLITCKHRICINLKYHHLRVYLYLFTIRSSPPQDPDLSNRWIKIRAITRMHLGHVGVKCLLTSIPD